MTSSFVINIGSTVVSVVMVSVVMVVKVSVTSPDVIILVTVNCPVEIIIFSILILISVHNNNERYNQFSQNGFNIKNIRTQYINN